MKGRTKTSQAGLGGYAALVHCIPAHSSMAYAGPLKRRCPDSLSGSLLYKRRPQSASKEFSLKSRGKSWFFLNIQFVTLSQALIPAVYAHDVTAVKLCSMKDKLSCFRQTTSKAGRKATSGPVSCDKKQAPLPFSPGATPPSKKTKEYHSDEGNGIIYTGFSK